MPPKMIEIQASADMARLEALRLMALRSLSRFGNGAPQFPQKP